MGHDAIMGQMFLISSTVSVLDRAHGMHTAALMVTIALLRGRFSVALEQHFILGGQMRYSLLTMRSCSHRPGHIRTARAMPTRNG